MTLQELAYDLAESVGNENDHAFVERMKFHVKNYRALFFRRDQSRGNQLPVTFIQSIGCLDMIKVPSTECCGVDLGCYVYRTKETVPVPIRIKNGDAFTYVGTIDGSTPITQTSKTTASYRSFDKFQKSKAFYVYEGGYIYLFGLAAKKLLIKGVFEDPEDLVRYKSCDGQCYSPDDPFPLPADMAAGVLLTIKQEVLGVQPEDETEKIDVDE